MPRIYTKTGDDGTTGLLFGGRVGKDDLITEAYGTTDEAVAALGLARALTNDDEIAAEVLALQRDLFVVGADLATNPEERDRLEPGVSLVTDEMVGALEARIDGYVAARPLPQVFIVPGANPASAAIDLARSIVRRGERAVVALERADRAPNPAVRIYLNRLSDLLFVLARRQAGETEPVSRGRDRLSEPQIHPRRRVAEMVGVGRQRHMYAEVDVRRATDRESGEARGVQRERLARRPPPSAVREHLERGANGEALVVRNDMDETRGARSPAVDAVPARPRDGLRQLGTHDHPDTRHRLVVRTAMREIALEARREGRVLRRREGGVQVAVPIHRGLADLLLGPTIGLREDRDDPRLRAAAQVCGQMHRRPERHRSGTDAERNLRRELRDRDGIARLGGVVARAAGE